MKTVTVIATGALVLTLAACAPPGTYSEGYRDVDWPLVDHAMSASELREIEVLLGRLGYNTGTVDGRVTQQTRAAISAYQGRIGAPQTGVGQPASAAKPAALGGLCAAGAGAGRPCSGARANTCGTARGGTGPRTGARTHTSTSSGPC